MACLPTKKSFSFQAVTESANALEQTTTRLQGLLTDLQLFVDGKSLSRESTAVTAAFQGAVDHAAKRSAQLLVLFFVLLISYPFVRTFIQRAVRRPTGT